MKQQLTKEQIKQRRNFREEKKIELTETDLKLIERQKKAKLMTIFNEYTNAGIYAATAIRKIKQIREDKPLEIVEGMPKTMGELLWEYPKYENLYRSAMAKFAEALRDAIASGMDREEIKKYLTDRASFAKDTIERDINRILELNSPASSNADEAGNLQKKNDNV